MSKTNKSSVASFQINQYEEKVLSFCRALESITNTPITLDESMTEIEMRIACRAQKLIQASTIFPIQPIGMDKLILQNLKIGQQEQDEFDSCTEHSSDQKLKISYNAQQIVDLATKDPQAGKITFVAKLVREPGVEFNYIVQNIKPKSHKQILQVHQIRSFGNFALYQINTDSSYKQITIHLKSGTKNLASSKVLSFAPRDIYISEDLSYDFKTGTQLRINPLQGFIAACILEGERFCEQIIEISGKKTFKSYIINGDYKIDQHTKALISSSKSSVTFLKMLKFFLEEDEMQFSKPTFSINKKTFILLAKIYIQQILKFKTNPDSMQEGISQQQIVEYFELFLHFICLKQLEMIEIKFEAETQKQIKAKTQQIIKYSFRTGEVSLYHKFIKFCISTRNFILQLGHDTINEYITEFSIKSPDAVQAGFQNILYHARNNQNKSKSVVIMLLQTFLKTIYQSGNIYQKHIRDILKLSSQVFMEIDPETLNLQSFNYLYTVYYMFRSNKQLVGVARDQKLRSIITDFVSQLKERIQRGDQKQRLLGLSIIERFFITQRDDELIGETVPLKNWIPYFFQSFYKNQKILSILVKLLLEMIKRTQTLFSQQIIKSISICSCKTLQKLPIEDSLTIINKHFKQQFLHMQKAMQVISDYLIAPLIAKLLPQDQITVDLLVNEHHREWNHGFKYHLFINEMIVEKMLRIINKIFKNNQFGKIQAIKKMKAEINRNLEDQNDQNSIRAIVQIQFIELSQEKLWEYFIEQRGYLKSLIKILKKNDQRSKELNTSLKKIYKALVNRKVPFTKIHQIKKMKPYEWYLFEELTNDHDIPNQILLQKNRIDLENGMSVQQIVISHFTSYNREFDDDKIGEIQSYKKDLFKSMINMETLLKLVHPIFEFQLQNPNNIKLAQNLIKNITNQFEMSSNSLFQKHCQEIVCTLQSKFEVNQQSIKELMMDKQVMRKQQSFNEALTRYFTDKKLFGPVGVFLKYLFEKQAYFSYSQQFFGRLIESQAFHLGQENQVKFQKARKSPGYHQFMKDIFKVKSPFIKTEYNNVKMQKRMPNPNRRYTIKVSRPRLIPYSKVECQTLLNFNQKQLGWMAKQIYLHKEEQKNYQAYDAYANELKKKTSFKNPQYNFYSKYFDEDKNLKTMLFYDLLADFLTLKGLPIRFVPRFYEVMAPIIYLQENNVKFAKMVAILLGFEDIWIEIFKILSTFYQQDSVLEVLRFRSRTTTLSVEVMKQYCEYVIDQIVNCLLDPNCLRSRFNTDKYCRVVVNSLFHIEKLLKKLQLNTSRELLKLISIRTALVFLELYDPANKKQNVQNFITKIAQNQRLNYYQIALSIFDALKEQAKPEQIKLINQFQANTLFSEWLKQKDTTKKNLYQFIIKCNKDENFAHNSVATLNHFLQVLKLQYRDIMSCFKKLNNRQQKNGTVVEQLLVIGEESNKKKFRDNLSIVIVNMFMQKIMAAFEKGDILQQKAKEFEDLLKKLQTGQVYGVAKHFIFAFVKVYLENYIDKFARDDVNYRRTYDLMDNILSNETSEYCSNFRFFCAKLLRTRMLIKQIKTEYVKKKKCKWIGLIQSKLDFFSKNESRSIFVPKVTSSTSQNLKDIIKSIMENDGKPDRFDELIAAGCSSPYNRYCLFNFFLRFYFSMLYNHKDYKASVINKLEKQKAKYERAIGQIQFQLIWRYANNKFDDNIYIKAPQEFSQDKIVFFNNFNWLLAIKQANSPLNSLFFQQGGKLHKNFISAFQNQFFPCGPENPYINIAQAVYELTRNNDIGVFLCSSKCDVLYCALNCGWPNETIKCPACGQPIGSKPGKSNTIVKDEQGARRVMSPKLKDAGANFYISNLSKVPFFFDAQRCYIQAQINRMKQKTEVVAGGKQVKLTGYQVLNQGRVSSLTHYIVRQILNSILYCLTSMKLISPGEVANLFKVKDYQQAKTYIWNKHTDDINYIKKALNLDNKIYGWIYGVHSFIFETCLKFKQNFNQYVIQTQIRANEMIKNIENEIAQKTIKDIYHQIFKDFINSLRNGLITKQLVSTTTYNAHNRFTRDIFQILLERFIKKATSQEKFKLAQQSFELQGCMQFPNDIYLTEDKIDQEKFQFSKLFKLPDKVIRYNEIVVSFQPLIRQQYPFLNYLLKNCEQINSMNDFRNILLFSNYLFAEVTNTFERIDAQKPIGQFIQELKTQKQHQMQSILKHPEIVVNSWNKLAKRLGLLQYKCTAIGQMNDQYSLQTPVKAFLIDNVSKKNPYGLILSVVFCNFAEMHNDIMNMLITKKNQIPQYKCLNLLNQNLLFSTQNFKESDVYIITQKQLEEKLYQFSIPSINYGRNFIFTNFQSYQQYFIMKLLGKGLFNTKIEDLKSICYNGQAFAKTSEYSNTLTQIKSYFDTPLVDNQKRLVRQILRKKDQIKQRQECAIKIRGDLERIMIIIKKSNGIIDAKNIQDFKTNYQVAYSIIQTNQFEDIEVSKIIALYEQLELEMKPSILQKLHIDYQFNLQSEVQQQLWELFNILPLEENDESVTLSEFGYALYRFIARNLQGNMVENDVNLLAFLPERDDFWPKGFDVNTKLALLTKSPVLLKLTLKHLCAVFSLVQKMIHKKVGKAKN